MVDVVTCPTAHTGIDLVTLAHLQNGTGVGLGWCAPAIVFIEYIDNWPIWLAHIDGRQNGNLCIGLATMIDADPKLVLPTRWGGVARYHRFIELIKYTALWYTHRPIT